MAELNLLLMRFLSTVVYQIVSLYNAQLWVFFKNTSSRRKKEKVQVCMIAVYSIRRCSISGGAARSG